MAFLSGEQATLFGHANPVRGTRGQPEADSAADGPRGVPLLSGGAISVAAITPINARILAIAALQRRLVSRGQLQAARIEASAIDRRVRSRFLFRVHPSVYAVGGPPDGPLAAETAALLAVRAGGALSEDSAGALWQIAPADPRRVHVTVHTDSRSGRPAGVVVHRSRILTAVDVRIRDGLPVLSPARTLLDLAATHQPRELERALSEAVVLELVEHHELVELLRRAGAHRGVAPLRAALEALGEDGEGTTLTQSEGEERFLALVREAGLPQPLVNVHRHGWQIDFLWPDQRVAVEIDGYPFHRSRARFERDRRRDADLAGLRILTVRVTGRQLRYEPMAVIARVAGALAAFAAR